MKTVHLHCVDFLLEKEYPQDENGAIVLCGFVVKKGFPQNENGAFVCVVWICS